ncbi:peptidoglycan-binding domain-containing protein [Leifsonia sp. F6_8S_P_1B]|uniref:Peptidoglycan-binding domain-containing protein n=1 Tax=Leifsonia williamsii TaxID=3035919 RepID=A0ABT8KIN1_9MICO|nr:peptidoglycan-binding protein [Leifsonia williamsii]MDN4616169.1 peptidoglycan-binding domain-containing protein [Leifsonia williamsii]
MSGALRTTPIVALWVAPVILAAVLLPMAGAAEEAAVSPSIDRMSTVGERERAYRQAVDVALTYPPEIELIGGVAGTVTSVDVAVGGAPSNGQKILSVDQRPVYIITGNSPLYRPLGRGDTGADVRTLTAFLVARALLTADEIDDVFGPRVEWAVRSFQREEGLEVTGVFDPAVVVFAPPGLESFTAVVPLLGSLISSGSPIVRGRGAITDLVLTVSGAPDQRPRPPAGALVLEMGGTDVPVSSVTPSTEEAAALAGSLTDAVARGDAKRLQGDDGTTRYSGVFLKTAAAERVGVVPGSAVLAGSAGRRCIVIGPDPAHASSEILAFAEPMPGEVGVVAIPHEFAGRRFLIDPTSAAAETRRRCR